MAIKDCWLFDGERASQLFGGIRNTPAGKMMDEIDDIFQPLANDINSWGKVKDIGKFSDKTIKELKEAWAAIPDKQKALIKKVMKYLIKKLKVSPQTLINMMQVYVTSFA